MSDVASIKRRAEDHKMESVMGRLLQVGVLLSSACVLVGGVLFLRTRAAGIADYRVFSSEPAELRQVKSLVAALAAGRPEAIIQLGVLLLIATPIARVIFAGFSFAVERDRLYVVVSLVVLGVLMVGLLHTS
jgi:uncharacterized membrane protein